VRPVSDDRQNDREEEDRRRHKRRLEIHVSNVQIWGGFFMPTIQLVNGRPRFLARSEVTVAHENTSDHAKMRFSFVGPRITAGDV
jgi:hypothetical protein